MSDKKEYKCPYCDFKSKSPQGLNLHIYHKHRNANAQKEDISMETSTKPQTGVTGIKEKEYKCPHCDFIARNPQALGAHIRHRHQSLKKENLSPKSSTRSEEKINLESPSKFTPKEMKQEVKEQEVKEEIRSPELDILNILSSSGISIEMINSAIEKMPAISSLSTKIQEIEQKMVDIVSVLSAMNEQMKPLVNLYNQYKPTIEQATSSANPTVSPAQQAHTEAQQIAQMATGGNGANPTALDRIERFAQLFLRGMELSKTNPTPQPTPQEELQKNLLQSLNIVNTLTSAARSSTLNEFKELLNFFKELSKGGVLANIAKAPKEETEE